MEQTEESVSLQSHVIKWGLITGGVSIVLTVLLYVVDYTMMVQLKTLFLSLLLYLGITIYAGIDYRNSVGGFLPYGKAFVHGFLVLAISALVATLFTMVLYHVIDPELPQNLTDASIENTREIMAGFGAPEETIDAEIEKVRERTTGQFTVSGQLMSFAYILFFSAIMALISAIFVKKNQPVEL
ncbi:MAG: DUF4199 domain-containing protein [Bacteroidetes bacterium CHB5]|nr:DUF4199 domain-containing protein [Bacteroidetes bacterium CHB5]